MMYKSPVEIVVGELKNQQENHIFSVIQEIGVNVDKDELIKALEYDRKQYEKGYDDGIKEFAKKIYNYFRSYENYDRLHIFEILYGIDSVEEQVPKQ